MAASALWHHSAASQFCPRCGTLLSLSDAGDVSCASCHFHTHLKSLVSSEVVSHSHPQPPPEWLAEYRASQAALALAAKGGVAAVSATQQAGAGRAVVREECPACKAPEMTYYTMQLRSADEGQTVFYECLKCGHKYSVNT